SVSEPAPRPEPAPRETHERTQVGPPPAAPPLEATRVGPPPSSPAARGAEAPGDDAAEDAESAEARARRLRESWPWIEEGNEETTRVGYLPEAGADGDGKTRVALTPPALSPVLRARVAALAARLLERGRIEHEAEALQLVVRVGLAALEELDD
ncbi:MAG: hypothetical protein CMH59_08060, partial [Myxococcales bacterium]|nr:hypothetical protein [Myxococcales bacterium]